MTDTILPLTYRSAEIGRIFTSLAAGDSIQVIGIGSSGKSNLMRYLMRGDVRQMYLGEQAGRLLLIYIDANKLLRRDDWGLYELMLHQLLIEMETRGAPERIVQALDDLHRRATEKDTLHLALRYLDRALALVGRADIQSIAFLLDEFDSLARDLSPACFAALRALRDDHKYALMYITAARRPLNELRDTPADIESFAELLSGNTIWLMTYCETDAMDIVRRIAGRYNLSFDREQTGWMLAQTGCHPGLLRGMIKLARNGDTLPAESSLPQEALVLHPVIQEECQQIWRSLPVQEQRALSELANGRGLDAFPGLELRLREKGLLLAEGRIFAPLLAEYICQVKPPAGAVIEIDRARRTVRVQGRLIPNLTDQEFSCLDFLEQHQGEICSPEAIARYYEGTAGLEISVPEPSALEEDKMLYRSGVEATIKRLRKKIEPEPGKPRFILTIRGRGFMLAEGE